MEAYGLNPLSEQIKLDFRSGEPLYLQIARQVEQLVANGSLLVGDQLPTVRELATGLRINFNTVARAYRLLDEEKLISTQRGRGTYIWEQPTEETLKHLQQVGLQELAQNYVREAARLGFSTQEAAAVLEEVIRAGVQLQEPAANPAEPENM
jgi:DNA-binding transcriptional regulator YhcF (GntR family)